MSAQRLYRPAKGRDGCEKRSLMVPCGLWAELQTISEDMNDRRDPKKQGKITPSVLLNVAMRDWLQENERDSSFYEDKAA